MRVAGEPVPHEPVAGAMGGRARLPARRRSARLARRAELGADPGATSSRPARCSSRKGARSSTATDREGFSAGAAQFDSDITVGRYPRCALGVSESELMAVCCDGRRSGVDGGLDLGELARLMISFGAP